jgi:nitrogen fixation/metabolism regulation signal transduction histidine kinase
VASTTGVFGGVTIGANVAEFHRAAATVRGSIEAEQARLEQRLLLVSALAVAILVATGVVIARGITRPVMRLTEAARVMERGELDTTTLDTLLHRRVVDEVTTLSQVFKRMAEQVQLREQRLRQEIVQLHIRIDERKKQQEISDIVGTDFFRNLQATADSMRSRGRRPGRDDRTEVDS